jgi:hypothetical protein
VRDDTIWRSTGEEDEEPVSDDLFKRVEYVLSHKQPHHIVWLFVTLMEMNVRLYTAVASTFPGPPNVFEEIFGYLSVKLNGVVRSPWHPSTAGEIMRVFHLEVYAVLCYGSMRIVTAECSPGIEKTSCPKAIAAEKASGKRGRKSQQQQDQHPESLELMSLYGKNLSTGGEVDPIGDLLDAYH